MEIEVGEVYTDGCGRYYHCTVIGMTHYCFHLLFSELGVEVRKEGLDWLVPVPHLKELLLALK